MQLRSTGLNLENKKKSAFFFRINLMLLVKSVILFFLTLYCYGELFVQECMGLELLEQYWKMNKYFFHP